jgi:NADPH-dependent glutamate synthase beta subunit-like oxidoreductase/NAD(P)H-flavin reductase
MSLGHGIAFDELYDRDGLVRLDAAFRASLPPDLAERLDNARATPPTGRPESDLIVALAPALDDFLAELFSIRADVAALAARQDELAPLFQAKRLFVQRRALKAVPAAEAAALDGAALARRLGNPGELDFAETVLAWLDDEAAHGEDLALAARYAAWAVAHADSQSVLFRLPAKRDPFARIATSMVEHAGLPALACGGEERDRAGFALTDVGTGMAGALDQIHYCILCHHQGKDSCSKGFPAKGGGIASNPVGVVMEGCPLAEKISEMHEVRGAGHVVAALAVAVIDNAMVAGTGHRICNDCMNACIYQGQNRDPVDIPQAETRVLKDVLELPFGFEIYSLLTRWNPLDFARPLPRPDTGRKVLVVGSGPAGFTLAHHLMQDGHTVVAVDGLKIEPLPAAISGIDPFGARVPFEPIRDIAKLWEPLDSRVNAGFGGVAEYGITVRWDKNFLKVIRLLLERRRQFLMLGGVRFGGTLTFTSAQAMGFDHVALCMGAGKPTVLALPNGLARGVRQASDFLMALQLTGAARADTIANLQLRLPVVVIGGGLTAIDTCTEALAYYPVQVEKFRARYDILASEVGEAAVRRGWSAEEAAIADEFLSHARALAAASGAAARRALLQGWGGAIIAYRRRLIDSPAYRNHEEIAKALEEGIRFAEQLSPLAVEVDADGHARGLLVRGHDGAERVLPARAILIAAGTVPNTTLARETAGLKLDGKFFQALDESGAPVTPEGFAKPAEAQVLMDARASFFGDLHPSYAGNVVSAMASAKQGYPVISRAMAAQPPSLVPAATLFARLNDTLRPRVHAVNRLTPNIVEVVVRAPIAARAFAPGQFYRLQNFETLAPRAGGTILAMEGLALTGAWTDIEQGLVGLVVLEMGGSSDLVARLQPGEPVVLMGPTGTATDIPEDQIVLLAGGGLGNAVLFSIGRALRAKGCRVLYFAGYRTAQDRFKVDDIEAAADVVVWCVDNGAPFPPGRPQDCSFVGNIVAAMAAYAEGRLGAAAIAMAEVDRVIAIGSDRMMAAVAAARHGVLAPFLKPGHTAIGSINSPMQCMMKEICAQCLQRHIDPLTGEERVVFSCFNQDQELDRVDWSCLKDRLGQNGVQEKLTRDWVRRCLAR